MKLLLTESSFITTCNWISPELIENGKISSIEIVINIIVYFCMFLSLFIFSVIGLCFSTCFILNFSESALAPETTFITSIALDCVTHCTYMVDSLEENRIYYWQFIKFSFVQWRCFNWWCLWDFATSFQDGRVLHHHCHWLIIEWKLLINIFAVFLCNGFDSSFNVHFH